MANAVIHTSRTMLEDMEANHKGKKSMVLVDDHIKIFTTSINRIAIAMYMIQLLLNLRCISQSMCLVMYNSMYCLMKSPVRCRLSIYVF